MWARVVEFMLGCWLAISPFVFQHGDMSLLWAVDFTTSLLIVHLALFSYWQPTRHAHLATGVIALALIAFGRLAGGMEPGAAYQNYILVGLLLLMFAIVPNHASGPPRNWYASSD